MSAGTKRKNLSRVSQRSNLRTNAIGLPIGVATRGTKWQPQLGLRNAAENGTDSSLTEARDAPNVPGDEGTTNVAEAGAKRAMAEQEKAPFI